MAKQMLNDLKEGDKVQTYFLVREKTKLLTRANKPYLSVDLLDRDGSINGKMWDNAERTYDCFERGDVVAVRGLASAYQGRMQLKIVDIRAVDERDAEMDMSEIIPHTSHDPETMWAQLLETIETVENDQTRELLTKIFNDEKIGPTFKNATAARDMHHNYVGGLLEHTLSVTAIADFMCGHYGAEVNRDIVITGALLHDIGKIEEIAGSHDFNYTIEGSLKGHLVIGVGIVGDFAGKIKDFPRETLLLIEHILVSHHGLKE